jgi:hypothetical protein
MEGKNCFIEDDVTRNNDTMRLNVETTVPFVIAGIAEEDARDRSRSELMRGCG